VIAVSIISSKSILDIIFSIVCFQWSKLRSNVKRKFQFFLFFKKMNFCREDVLSCEAPKAYI